MYGGGPAKPKTGLLGGLRTTNPNVSAFAKGQAMAGQAALGMERAKGAQEMGVQQMQQDSQLRQQEGQNKAQRAGNESQQRIAEGDLDSRRSVFDTSMAYDYAGLQKRNRLNFQQALINGMARDF